MINIIEFLAGIMIISMLTLFIVVFMGASMMIIRHFVTGKWKEENE